MSVDPLQNLNTAASVQIVSPQYDTDIVTFYLDKIIDFVQWFNETACAHAAWSYKKTSRTKKVAIPGADDFNRNNHSAVGYIKCRQAGSPPSWPEGQPRQRNRFSKKVNCKASIRVYFMLDGRMKVMYNWKHQSHDPTDRSSTKHSRAKRSSSKSHPESAST